MFFFWIELYSQNINSKEKHLNTNQTLLTELMQLEKNQVPVKKTIISAYHSDIICVLFMNIIFFKCFRAEQRFIRLSKLFMNKTQFFLLFGETKSFLNYTRIITISLNVYSTESNRIIYLSLCYRSAQKWWLY